MVHRLIARLDIKGDNVVRGMQLEGLRVVGTPEEMARRYAAQGIDEIIFLDTVATLYGRNQTLPVVERTARNVFIPLTVGGGIRSVEDVAEVLRSGADKVAINSAAVRNPELLTDIARVFGSQCVVSSITARRRAPGQWAVRIDNGREQTDLDAVEWAQRCWELGAGEFLVTSIDQDGMRQGYDLDLIRAIVETVPVPVIASGGPGEIGHVVEAFEQAGASAVALGTLLHFDLADVVTIKQRLAAVGVPVRPVLGEAEASSTMKRG